MKDIGNQEKLKKLKNYLKSKCHPPRNNSNLQKKRRKESKIDVGSQEVQRDLRSYLKSIFLQLLKNSNI